MEFSGMQFMNANTFYQIQRNLVIPSVNKVYNKSIAAAREEVRDKDTVIIGDGRFDSPGKCAKYCTYSCQSPSTNKIVATATLQTVKGKGSSPLEMEGFKECLNQLDDDEFEVSTVATDRNRQISKWLREQRPDMKHRYDPWHFAKNIKGKLRPLAEKKGCKILGEWIKPIGNLFFCAQNCNNDPDMLIEMWKSLLHHISNRHHFGSLYTKYPYCRHKKYTKKESQMKKWIKKDSSAYDQLEKIIMDKRNLADMPKLANAYHTGSIDVFNSLVNMYANKRKEFDINVMDARIKLAAIDFNVNVKRKQAVVQKQRSGSGIVGEKKWKIQIAKQSKEWVAKEVKTPKSYSFVTDLLKEVLSMKLSGTSVETKSSEIEWSLKSPQNIAGSERPERSSIIAKLQELSRFVSK